MLFTMLYLLTCFGCLLKIFRCSVLHSRNILNFWENWTHGPPQKRHAENGCQQKGPLQNKPRRNGHGKKTSILQCLAWWFPYNKWSARPEEDDLFYFTFHTYFWLKSSIRNFYFYRLEETKEENKELEKEVKSLRKVKIEWIENSIKIPMKLKSWA